ncbi:MaoC family dehydratase [Maricurvus nonylphenolicus]|uniref:MaoC/PaaZ C-terminal domain-containing protein n=1 Tax=Maricurvus nonylphenolicus TaxID=1008307 RepID=UPI0036F32EFE
MRFLEDLSIGETAETPQYLITREEIIDMASRWDPQPFHIDEDVAKAGLFGDVIACTAHLFSVMSMLCNQLPEHKKPAMIAGLGFDEAKTHRPVMPNDTVRVEVETIEARPSDSNPSRGVMTWQHKMFNQDDVLVFSMKSSVLVKRR